MDANRVAAVGALLRAYHREELALSDERLDEALGLQPQRQVVGSSYDGALEACYPTESIVYLPTPYPICRAFFHAISLDDRDLVIDLGCGVGRLVLYGALTTQARFRGVELVDRRYAAARRAAARLVPSQVEIIHGNVLDQNLDAGTVFYVFRPFSEPTEAQVVSRLHTMARRRSITIGVYRLPPSLFDPDVFRCTWLGDLQIYRS